MFADKKSPVKNDRALNLRRRIHEVFDRYDSTVDPRTDHLQIANPDDECNGLEGFKVTPFESIKVARAVLMGGNRANYGH